MIDGKRVIGLIPARGGSKGLPGKNIRPMNGKPLLEWTIRLAQKSKYLDTIVVSTDDSAIADVAKHCGLPVPFLRPESLASDTASTFDAVKHTLEFYKTERNRSFDMVCLLEPTSPLREDNDIDTMIETLMKKQESFDSIVSIGEVQTHPHIMTSTSGEHLVPYLSISEKVTRRQDLPDAYFPFGVAYIVKTSSLLAEKTFYTKRCTYHKIKRYQCYEIDDLYDFIAVEAVMKHEWRLNEQ